MPQCLGWPSGLRRLAYDGVVLLAVATRCLALLLILLIGLTASIEYREKTCTRDGQRIEDRELCGYVLEWRWW